MVLHIQNIYCIINSQLLSSLINFCHYLQYNYYLHQALNGQRSAYLWNHLSCYITLWGTKSLGGLQPERHMAVLNQI